MATPTANSTMLAARWIVPVDARRRRITIGCTTGTRVEITSIRVAMVSANRPKARKAEKNPPVLKAKAATAARMGATQPKPTAMYATPYTYAERSDAGESPPSSVAQAESLPTSGIRCDILSR